jgi:NADPH:quinone reductase-like Zn-dependent oxidoreductase
MSLPKTTKAWTIRDTKNGFDELQLEKDYAVPELGEHDCLVQIQAVSLNYRDLIIPQGKYPFPVKTPLVPGSDGAGNIFAIGSGVTRFSKGDKVCTLFNQKHQSGTLTPSSLMTGLGGALDGTLRQYAVFSEDGLVLAPSNLTPTEASTLTCAPLTAWNALYGLESKAFRPGQTVLTEGTGGVSLAAIQFAVAAGAIVIATTSSDEKGKRLKELGAHHVINYKTNPSWGEHAKKISPGGLGVDHVIEVGGPSTMEQALKAVRFDGVISVIGFLGGAGDDKQPSTLDALTYQCIIRGILVGSRAQFEEMNRAVEANNIHIVVDEKRFGFEDLKAAYQYQWDQKAFGKTVVQLGRLE